MWRGSGRFGGVGRRQERRSSVREGERAVRRVEVEGDGGGGEAAKEVSEKDSVNRGGFQRESGNVKGAETAYKAASNWASVVIVEVSCEK